MIPSKMFIVLPLLPSFALLLLGACDRSGTSGLKGQTNATLTFYGKVVDQDGKPLPDARFEFRLEAYPKDWTFETRGRNNDASLMSAISDEQGQFKFTVTGCELFRMKAERKGYRHFYDLDVGDSRAVDNTGYRLIAWSDLLYKSDPDHPAVFVFVKDGASEVSALPCKGGYDSGNGTHWTLNKPGWPKQPSLPDVDQKGAQPRVNAKVPLVIKVVDPDGRPIPNVLVWLDVERYRSLEEMARDNYNKTRRTTAPRVSTETGNDGMATIELDGFRIVSVGAAVQGSKWNQGPFLLNRHPRDDFYARQFMDESGKVIYRCDAANPMVLVMYPKNAQEVHVLPCPGGYELRDGQWVPVQSRWMEDTRGGIRYLPPASTQSSVGK